MTLYACFPAGMTGNLQILQSIKQVGHAAWRS